MVKGFVFEVDLDFSLRHILDQRHQDIEVMCDRGFLASVARFRQRNRQIESQAQDKRLVQAGFAGGCGNQGRSDLNVMLWRGKVIFIAPITHVHNLT